MKSYLGLVLLCASSDAMMSVGKPPQRAIVLRMSSSSPQFDQPVRIGGVEAQRRMLGRGFSAAVAAAAGGALVPARSHAATPARAATVAGGLCSSCGSGQASLSSLCNTCATGARWYNPANERIFDTARGSYLPPLPSKFLSNKRLDGRTIVTIGEVHSNPCHHRLEFDIIRALSASSNNQKNKLSIGLEMFYRQHQNVLDRFVFGHKDFGTLKRDTNWDQNWGYDINYYAKIFQFAAMNGIRLVGLNVPFQVAQLVGQVGLNQLPSELLRLLPDVDLGVAKHREQFDVMMLASASQHGGLDDAALQRMYETQTLWDEYMAESAALHLKQNPLDTFVVIAGVGHVAGRVGIPDRIHRRLAGSSAYGRSGGQPFVVVPEQVDWNESSGLPDVAAPLTIDDCDWAWYTEKQLTV